MQTKMFRVNYLVGNRRGTSNLRVTSTSVSNAVNQNGGNGNNQNSQQNNQNNANNQNNQNGQNYQQQSKAPTSPPEQNDFWGDLKPRSRPSSARRRAGAASWSARSPA
jgi:MSHA biogenesis protein MshL